MLNSGSRRQNSGKLREFTTRVSSYSFSMRNGEFAEGISRPNKPPQTSTIVTDYGSAHISPTGYLSNVSINTSHRGDGHGHDLLKAVTTYADAYNLPLQAHVREDLHDFYGKHGFQVSHYDEHFASPVMHRRPR